MKRKLLFFICLLFTYTSYGQYWISLENGFGNSVACGYMRSVCADSKGYIYVGGEIVNTQENYSFVPKWDGHQWTELGNGIDIFTGGVGIINAVCTDNLDNVYATWGNTVMKFNGSIWTKLGNLLALDSILSGPHTFNQGLGINAICSDKLGNIYAATGYNIFNQESQSNMDYYYVAKWDGSKWSALGTGLNALNANGSINTIATDERGDLYAGGLFTNGTSDFYGSSYVTKWNGTKWASLPDPDTIITNAVNSIYVVDSNNIYAGGNSLIDTIGFYVAKWDGNKWSRLGTGTAELRGESQILSICVDKYSNVYASTSLYNSNTQQQYYTVVKWDSKMWKELQGSSAPIGSYLYIESGEPIESICTDTSGNIYAIGQPVFNNMSGIGACVAEFTHSTNSQSLTSVINISSNSNILAYPNPIVENVTIKVTQAGLLKIYNSLGELVKWQNIVSGDNVISMINTSAGIYTIIFTNESSNYLPLKVIKK